MEHPISVFVKKLLI